jgi:hypothetical protein
MADDAFDFINAQLRAIPTRGRGTARPRRKRIADIYVDGLDVVVAAATAESKEARQKMRREIRRIARPVTRDIKSRFEQLGGVGPRVAKTVGVRFSGNDVAFAAGRDSMPFTKGREFGAKRSWTKRHVATVGWRTNRYRKVVAKNMAYSGPKQFGPWTGNQFDLGLTGERLSTSQVSGRAFYPSIAEGVRDMDEKLKAYVEQTLKQLRQA